MLSYRSFIVLCFTFGCTIHFEFIFVTAVSLCLGSFIAFGHPIGPALFVKETILAPLCCLCSFVKDQLTVYMWVCVWALFSAPLVYLSVLSPIPHCLDFCSLIVSFEGRSVSHLPLFPFSIVLAILGLLPLHINFRISLLIFTK